MTRPIGEQTELDVIDRPVTDFDVFESSETEFDVFDFSDTDFDVEEDTQDEAYKSNLNMTLPRKPGISNKVNQSFKVKI